MLHRGASKAPHSAPVPEVPKKLGLNRVKEGIEETKLFFRTPTDR